MFLVRKVPICSSKTCIFTAKPLCTAAANSFFPQTKKADRAQPRAQPARKYGVISRKRSTPPPQNIHCIVNIMRLFYIPPPILICNVFIIFSRICQDTISCKKISSRGRGIAPRPRRENFTRNTVRQGGSPRLRTRCRRTAHTRRGGTWGSRTPASTRKAPPHRGRETARPRRAPTPRPRARA